MDGSSGRWLSIDQLVDLARAPSTNRSYERVWLKFKSWIDAHGLTLNDLVPDDVIDFVMEIKNMGRGFDWNSFLPMLKIKLLRKAEWICEDKLLLEVLKGVTDRKGGKLLG